MAAQAVSAHAPNVRQGATTPTSLTYKPIAGSPTLTNPDMILPDYDRSDSPDDRSHSPIMLWNNPQIGDMQFHLPQSQPSYTQTYTQQAYHQPSYPQPSYHHQPSYVTGSTPIIYGNGTMLSDIGEVTEVESVVGKGARRSSHLSVPSDDDIALRSSPTMGAARLKSKSQVFARERRSSLESNSTVTTQGPNGEFAEFDDTVSVDDVHFQGDDEESMASSYVEGTAAKEPGVGRRPMRPISTDDYSLSDRAEQILANAKRRLSTMEGNLSRARNSLYYSPMSDGSTPSPPIVRPVTSFRDPTAPLSAGLPTGHSRMLSDSSLHDDPVSAGFPRSASALGAAGGYRQPLTSSRSADALGAGIGRKLTYQPLDSTLGPLSEDEDRYPIDDQFGQLLSPFGYGSDKDITRSMSVAQVRDLKDQMNDLKGKISSLKEQARADSLKRRSLQSLRTPSPFTHARWDQGFMEPRAIKNAGKEDTLQPPPADYEVRQPTPNYTDVVAEVQADMVEVRSVDYESAHETPTNERSVDGSNSTRTEHAVEHKQSTETIGQDEGRVVEQHTNDEDIKEIHVDEQHIAEQEHAEELVDEQHVEEQHEQRYVNDDIDEELEHFGEDEHHLVADDEEYEMHQHLEEHTTLEEEMRQVEEEQWEEEEMEHELEEQEEEYDEEEQEGEGEYDDDVSESGESLYHDTYQEPLSHEDREDAFDYEHFFLHSAMGTISQQRGRRGSFDSVTSEDSIETTRGPVTDDPRAHRRISIDTLSSVNTFATATEGRTSRTSTVGDEDDRTAGTPDLSEYPEEPLSSKRTTFGGFHFPNEKASTDFHQQSHPRRNTIVHQPVHSNMTSAHRPSVSSFESTGTNRSFPLVNKTRISGGVLTPSGSPDHELDQISETLLNETASICEQESGNSGQSAAIELLPREDRILVEKLVASVGKCVLSLSEVSKASTEARMYRRRLEAARRILEGLEE